MKELKSFFTIKTKGFKISLIKRILFSENKFFVSMSYEEDFEELKCE